MEERITKSYKPNSEENCKFLTSVDDAEMTCTDFQSCNLNKWQSKSQESIRDCKLKSDH